MVIAKWHLGITMVDPKFQVVIWVMNMFTYPDQSLNLPLYSHTNSVVVGATSIEAEYFSSCTIVSVSHRLPKGVKLMFPGWSIITILPSQHHLKIFHPRIIIYPTDMPRYRLVTRSRIKKLHIEREIK